MAQNYTLWKDNPMEEECQPAHRAAWDDRNTTETNTSKDIDANRHQFPNVGVVLDQAKIN